VLLTYLVVIVEDADEIGTEDEFGGRRTPVGGEILVPPVNGR
jgi:hypothetical protein